MTVKQYLSIKDTLLNTTRRLYSGKWEALHNGKWISESAFRSLHPLPTVLNGCKTNPDRRRIFLID